MGYVECRVEKLLRIAGERANFDFARAKHFHASREEPVTVLSDRLDAKVDP